MDARRPLGAVVHCSQGSCWSGGGFSLSPSIRRRIFGEQGSRYQHLGQLERDVATWRTILAPILTSFSRSVGERPMRDLLR